MALRGRVDRRGHVSAEVGRAVSPRGGEGDDLHPGRIGRPADCRGTASQTNVTRVRPDAPGAMPIHVRMYRSRRVDSTAARASVIPGSGPGPAGAVARAVSSAVRPSTPCVPNLHALALHLDLDLVELAIGRACEEL